MTCLWWLLGVLERSINHPLAKCINAATANVSDLPSIPAPIDFEEVSGRGVRCIVEQLGGVIARVGNMQFYEETSLASLGPCGTQWQSELRAWVQRLQEQCNTVVVLHVDGRPLGAVALQDSIRVEAPQVIEYLQKSLGVEVWLCTGDNAAVAQSVARQVGIQNVVAEALPTSKCECVMQLQQRCGRQNRVCFVGDGSMTRQH